MDTDVRPPESAPVQPPRAAKVRIVRQAEPAATVPQPTRPLVQRSRLLAPAVVGAAAVLVLLGGVAWRRAQLREAEAAAQVTVPDVAGLPVLQAQSTLAALGLQPRTSRELALGEPMPAVTGQEPAAGTAVMPGAAVVLQLPEVTPQIEAPVADSASADRGESGLVGGNARIRTPGGGGVNLRSAPDNRSALIGRSSDGMSLEVVEERGDWLKVRTTDGLTCWTRWRFEGARYIWP